MWSSFWAKPFYIQEKNIGELQVEQMVSIVICLVWSRISHVKEVMVSNVPIHHLNSGNWSSLNFHQRDKHLSWETK